MNDLILDDATLKPSTELRPNQQRAKWAMILLQIIMGLDIASIISDLIYYNFLSQAGSGLGRSEIRGFYSNEIREEYLFVLFFIATIPAIIIFISWFRRAYYNLHIIYDNLSYSEGWAAGSWFVPIINLYRPYQIMKELYVLTSNFFSLKNIATSLPLSREKLGWWWGIWIISGLLEYLTITFSVDNKFDMDNSKAYTLLSIVNSLFDIIACVLIIKIIKEYSVAESILYENDMAETAAYAANNETDLLNDTRDEDLPI